MSNDQRLQFLYRIGDRKKNPTLSKQLEGIGVLEAIVHAWKAKSRNVKSSRG